jgi:hypothetical protein
MNKLHLESLNDTGNKYRKNWKRDVQRMRESILPRQIVDHQEIQEPVEKQEKVDKNKLKEPKQTWRP